MVPSLQESRTNLLTNAIIERLNRLENGSAFGEFVNGNKEF